MFRFIALISLPRRWTLRMKLCTALIANGCLPILLAVLLVRLPIPIALLLAILSIATSIGITKPLLTPITRLRETILQARTGDFSARSHLEQEDEIGQLASSFNALASQFETEISGLTARKTAIAEDISTLFVDVSRAIDGDMLIHHRPADGPLSDLANVIGKALQRCTTRVQDIGERASEVEADGLVTSSLVHHIVEEVQAQEQLVSQGAMTTSILTSTILELGQYAEKGKVISEEIAGTMHNGHTTVVTVQETMDLLRETSGRAGRHIKSLGESAQLTRQALTLVQRNTEELHIIAGNASIEAARHADSGGVFRDVADSIEALAEQSQLALRQIQDVVERNLLETMGLVDAIEEVTSRVASGGRVAQKAADALENLDVAVHNLASLHGAASTTGDNARGYVDSLAVAMSNLQKGCASLSGSALVATDAAAHMCELADGIAAVDKAAPGKSPRHGPLAVVEKRAAV